MTIGRRFIGDDNNYYICYNWKLLFITYYDDYDVVDDYDGDDDGGAVNDIGIMMITIIEMIITMMLIIVLRYNHYFHTLI